MSASEAALSPQHSWGRSAAPQQPAKHKSKTLDSSFLTESILTKSPQIQNQLS